MPSSELTQPKGSAAQLRPATLTASAQAPEPAARRVPRTTGRRQMGISCRPLVRRPAFPQSPAAAAHKSHGPRSDRRATPPHDALPCAGSQHEDHKPDWTSERIDLEDTLEQGRPTNPAGVLAGVCFAGWPLGSRPGSLGALTDGTGRRLSIEACLNADHDLGHLERDQRPRILVPGPE